MAEFESNSLREKILYEVNHFTPETLELLYHFIQLVKKTKHSPKEAKTETYPLSEFAGMLSYEEGQEMIDCINNEFNNIEGEW